MIGFYKDAALKRRVSPESPKRFLVPLAGGSCLTTLYLADPYTATITADASSGASTLNLDQTFEFPASGSAVVYRSGTTMTISYTGVTGTSLTGVTGISATIANGSLVRPNIVWRTMGNLVLSSNGADTAGAVTAAFGLPADSAASKRLTQYGVLGGAYVTSLAAITAGAENAVRIDAKVTATPGAAAEFANWQLATNTLYAYPFGNSSSIPADSFGVSAFAAGDLTRQDQALPLPARVLPSARQVTDTTPGFVIGQYRWRDQDQINAAALMPTRWDLDPVDIGLEKYTSGIGFGEDLKPLGLTEQGNSVFLTIRDGGYFDGPVRYFLPGTEQFEIRSASQLEHTLSARPATGKPVFVGRWRVDAAGFYSVAASYRRRPTFASDGTLQYRLNRAAGTLTLNQTLPDEVLLIGTLSGTGQDTFTLPVYPVEMVKYLYIPLNGDTARAPLSQFSFNRDEGTLTVVYTPGGLYTADQPVLAACVPAIAVQYEPEVQATSKSHTYRVAAAGPACISALAALTPSQSYAAGIWVDGAFTYALGNRYTVLVIDRATMANLGTSVFDLSVSGTAAAMASFLNNLDSSKAVIIASHGDPQLNHTSSGLDLAMARCGASSLYGSAGFCAGAAYILIGIPGIGINRGLEFYKGSGDNDPNACVIAQVTITEGNIPGIAAAAVAPAVPVSTDTRQLPIDLNPAFAGLSKGYIYLQHRKVAPTSIKLASDKPLIDIPATLRSIIDLVAYGPVYFNGDYSLLSATVYGPLAGETVPNVTMKVIADASTWSGLINYKDPTVEDVTVTSGADGIVNLIYVPKADWGWYIPTTTASGSLAGVTTTTIANDTLVLPQPVPVSQILDGSQWLVTTYSVFNDNPVYGMAGADTSKGQIPFITSGTPGTAGYKTNGRLAAWGGQNTVAPARALDANGHDQNSSSFSGEVVALVFAAPLPVTDTTAAYFLTILQRVQIQLQDVNSSIKSNPILLQMGLPALIVDNPWLRLSDAVQGRLNWYRVSWNANAQYPTSYFPPVAGGFNVGGFNTQPFGS